MLPLTTFWLHLTIVTYWPKYCQSTCRSLSLFSPCGCHLGNDLQRLSLLESLRCEERIMGLLLGQVGNGKTGYPGAGLFQADCRKSASAMPLLKRKPYQPSFTAPEGFNLGAEVFVVRFTGELFTSYEYAPTPSRRCLALQAHTNLITVKVSVVADRTSSSLASLVFLKPAGLTRLPPKCPADIHFPAVTQSSAPISAKDRGFRY